MNYHSDEWIMEKVQEHYNEALEYFPENRIVGIFLQGSQNYGLDYENSDIDTKLIVVPTFYDIAFARKPVSTTHIRENDEHIDFKDIRLMFGTFRKQNLNFLEILFTKYKIVNPLYEQWWNYLLVGNEKIARYNEFLAVKAMKGVAAEKYHALCHPYPNKLEVLEKFGYDPKQLHHLVRIEQYLYRYMKGEPYAKCLQAKDSETLKKIKEGFYDLESAKQVANLAMAHIDLLIQNNGYTKDSKYNVNDVFVDKLLDEVQYDIMEVAVKNELE